MKIAIIIIVVLAALIVLIAIVGAMLPREHRATRAANFPLKPDELFSIISDHAGQTAWREGLKTVEILPPSGGRVLIKETSSFGPMTIEVIEKSPPQRYVTKIADPDLAFGGTWTFEIEAALGGSRLRITEDGFVKNIFFRFMSKFIFSQTATIESYLKSLGTKCGREIKSEP
ncbi:MAG: SRPBCC family protein [Planctomycetes bacterium]|nr:SRPBCC family protein [Planctomycetota bacterium]